MPEDLRPPYRIQFDNARDPYSARNALGITSTGGGGGGAPTDAQYIVAADDPTLTNDRVLTNTATVTWDFTTPGQAKANAATGGGGNVSNSGTPTLGQYAKWVTATTIQGVAPATVLADIGAQPAGSYQPLDATLTALAGFTATGLVTQVGTDNFVGRGLVQPPAGISITNANGVGGNPSFFLADDLFALEALTGTNTIYYRSGTSAWSPVVVGTGLSFSGGTLTNTVTGGGDVFKNLSNTFTQQNFFTASVVLGHTSAVFNTGLELHGTAAGMIGDISQALWRNDAFSSSLVMAKSRGTTPGSHVAVTSGDNLGSIVFRGSNGTSFATRVEILAEANVGSSGKLSFWIHDGTTLLERLRLAPSGGMWLNGTNDLGVGGFSCIKLEADELAGVTTLALRGSEVAVTNTAAGGANNYATFRTNYSSIKGSNGTVDQDAGYVGEYLTASASSVALGAGAYTATATLAIPAGDWDIRGVVRVNGTAGSYMYMNVFTLAASSSGSPDNTQTGIFTGLNDVWTAVGPFRKRLTASTTHYLNIYMAIAGTLVFGEIQARRRN